MTFGYTDSSTAASPYPQLAVPHVSIQSHVQSVYRPYLGNLLSRQRQMNEAFIEEQLQRLRQSILRKIHQNVIDCRSHPVDSVGKKKGASTYFPLGELRTLSERIRFHCEVKVKFPVPSH